VNKKIEKRGSGLKPELRHGIYHRDQYHSWRSCWCEQRCCSSSPNHWSSRRCEVSLSPSSTKIRV